MPPNPPFDMSTTRSPGRCSRTMVAMMSSSEAASRADWPRVRRDRERAAEPTAAPPPAASIETPARSGPRSRGRTRGRSRPERCGGTTTPIAARRPPRCARPDSPRAGRPASRRPPSDDARSRRRPSRRGPCRRLRAAASRRRTGAAPSAIRVGADADVGRDRDGGRRVAHVVGADERHLKDCRTARPLVEP